MSQLPEVQGNLEISPLLPSEYGIPLEWSRREGWHNGDYDYQFLSTVDPTGLLAGRLNGEIVAIITALNWSNEFASVGGYVTNPEFRGKGIGSRVFKNALLHIGNRETCLFAVPEMAEKYGLSGFVADYSLTFYELRLDNQNIERALDEMSPVDLKTVNFKEISNFDREYFPASREDFLAKWIAQPNSVSLGVIRSGQLAGYGVMRKTAKNEQLVGPMYARSLDVAKALLSKFCEIQKTGNILIDVPDNNRNAAAFAEHFHLVPTVAVTHMRRNPALTRISHDGVYGVTTPEVGHS